MKHIVKTTTLFLFAGFVVATGFQESAAPLKQATYSIEGPFCSGCVGLLQEVSEQVEGVKDLEVDTSDWLVKVTFDGAVTSAEAIRDHVNAETRFELKIVGVIDAPEPQRSSLKNLCC